jgi:surface antigen
MRNHLAVSLASMLAVAGCVATPAYAPSTDATGSGITWSNTDQNAAGAPAANDPTVGQGIKWTDPVTGAPAPNPPGSPAAVTSAPASPAQAAPSSAAQPAAASMGQGIVWSAPPAGSTAAKPPVAGGPECREYQRTIIIDGKQELAYGTACRQPDGTWRIRP